MERSRPTKIPTLQVSSLPRPESNSPITVHEVSQDLLDAHGLRDGSQYDGAPGSYIATAMLAIPGKQTFFEHVHLNDFKNSGESLLLMPSQNVYKSQFRAEERTVTVRFIPNDSGQLARISVHLYAGDLFHAQTLAHDYVMSILSWLSYRHDVAASVAGWQFVEEATQSARYQFGVLGKSRAIAEVFNIAVKDEYRAALSSYREGLNSTNVFFQLLCFYRVVEWVRLRRVEREGEPRLLPDEQMPRNIAEIGDFTPDEQEEFRRFLGKSFQSVYHSYEMTMRNAIAHLDPKKVTLTADKARDYYKCLRAIPVIRYVSRRMLRNELLRDPAYTTENLPL